MAAGPAFHFDLASPEAYLAAERVLQVMPVATEWIPVLARDLPAPDAYEGWDAEGPRAAFAARAAERGLQTVRWPEPFPADTLLAMRAATYAKSVGRLVPFALAAFRQAFAGGHDLGDPDTVVIAGSACEMHPRALLTGCETRSVQRALDDATALAAARGVRDVPAIWVPDADPDGPGRVFHGDGDLERAASAAREAPR